MANHISHASLPYPVKNARFTVLIPYLDADGDPTDPTTPDTEVSQDGGTFGDAAEEMTTISGSNGMGYITLSGAETNNSAVGVACKVTSGPKATLATLYPRNLPILASGTASAGASGTITLASSITYDITGCFVRTTGGTGGGGTGGASNQARRITAYNSGTQVATITPNWETTPSSDTTYDVLCPEGVTIGMLKTLNPTSAGNTLDVSSGGEAGLDWNNIGTKTATNAFTNTTIATTQKVDLETIKTQSVTCSAGVTVPTLIASTTNLTAGTIATVTNRVTANTDQIAGSATAATNLKNLNVLSITVDTVPATDTIAITGLTIGSNNQYVGRVFIWDAATATAQLQGRAYIIDSSVAAGNKLHLIPTMAQQPDSGDTGIIVGSAQSHLVDTESGSITSTSIATDAITSSELAASAVTKIVQGIFRDTTAADFTQPASFGLSVMNGIALGSALLVTADAIKLGGSTQSLTDLKDFADAGYDPGSHAVLTVNDVAGAVIVSGYTGAGVIPQVLVETGIATLANQTHFTLGAGSADNDAYNGQLCIITDLSTSTQKAVVTIDDYVGSTKGIVLSATPAFNISTGDSVAIVAAGGASSGGATVNDIWNEPTSSHTTPGTMGKAMTDAQAAGNPWSSLTADNQIAGSFGLALGGGSGADTISAAFVDDDHTWTFSSRTQTTSPKILRENAGFNGLCRMDFTEPIPSRTVLNSVTDVSIDDGPTVAFDSLTADFKKVNISVDATGTDPGTYTVTITALTADTQTYVRKAVISIT